MTCPENTWIQDGKCYPNCKSGYERISTTCTKTIKVLKNSISQMLCKTEDWKQGIKCYISCNTG